MDAYGLMCGKAAEFHIMQWILFMERREEEL